jgi:hypothetical protein
MRDVWIGLLLPGKLRAKTAGVANSHHSNSHGAHATRRRGRCVNLHCFWLVSIDTPAGARQGARHFPLALFMKLKTL